VQEFLHIPAYGTGISLIPNRKDAGAGDGVDVAKYRGRKPLLPSDKRCVD